MEDDIMKKRMLSAILAMSMVMGMSSVTAFAEDAGIDDVADAGANAFEAVNDGYVEPTINVTVPTSGTVVLDPFNINQKGQVSSPDFKIINNSNVPLTATIKGANAIGSENMNILQKAVNDGTKWAVVSINVTDGLGKTTSKVVPAGALDSDNKPDLTKGIDVTATATMAPMGGVVKFNYSGTSAAVLAEGTAWDGEETITVSNTYAFVVQPFVKYDIKKTMISSVTELTVENGTAATDIDFPATVLGDGKEVPVTWVCEGYNASTAGNYTFTAKLDTTTDLDSSTDGTQSVASSGIYTIAENVTMPTITVTVEEAE